MTSATFAARARRGDEALDATHRLVAQPSVQIEPSLDGELAVAKLAQELQAHVGRAAGDGIAALLDHVGRRSHRRQSLRKVSITWWMTLPFGSWRARSTTPIIVSFE